MEFSIRYSDEASSVLFEHLAASTIISGMVVMYSSNWFLGWENRFYSIGVLGVVCGGEEEEGYE